MLHQEPDLIKSNILWYTSSYKVSVLQVPTKARGAGIEWLASRFGVKPADMGTAGKKLGPSRETFARSFGLSPRRCVN